MLLAEWGCKDTRLVLPDFPSTAIPVGTAGRTGSLCWTTALRRDERRKRASTQARLQFDWLVEVGRKLCTGGVDSCLGLRHAGSMRSRRYKFTNPFNVSESQ
jgi:hypothetical protein